MKNSNYIVIQQPTNLDKLEALKSFLKALKIKVEFSNTQFDIPDDDKKMVIDRIKNSKSEKLLDWDTVKNNFNGI
jgi:adenylate kinase family enzyme